MALVLGSQHLKDEDKKEWFRNWQTLDATGFMLQNIHTRLELSSSPTPWKPSFTKSSGPLATIERQTMMR